MSERLRIGARGVDLMLKFMRELGNGRHETALFWLGTPSRHHVTTLVIPEGSEVEWMPYSLRLSPVWMLRLAETCEARSSIVLGAVHSHPAMAFFSDIDHDGFFHAPGCLSIVLPNYGSTALAKADTEWAVLVGLRGGDWHQSRWSHEVLVDEGSCEVLAVGTSR